MTPDAPSQVLSRPDASAAVEELGWRVVLGTLLAGVPVTSLTRGLHAVQVAVRACGAAADEHLRADVRPDRVELAVHTRSIAQHTAEDVDLVRAVTGALADAGFTLAPPSGTRPVQLLEIAIDALDIAAIRPFWAAVFGYVDEPGSDGLIDPVRQGPALWFQQMTEPRPQRNRIHFDIAVAHDEAERRIQAALAAGGRLLSDDEARSFWILADAEGNEVCVCTWQDRD
jgi:4a-hydroxytetrahydrobiopterin dehydratase